jgi:8-oxo-dGTP pyrophosphatase MutT (NUDIX family)
VADAATLVIIDRLAWPYRVLFGRRHPRHAFMPGRLVFPGGRVDPADRRLQLGTPLEPVTLRKLLAETRFIDPRDAEAIVLAAIRETFEETGLVIGAKRQTVCDDPAGWEHFLSTGFDPDPSALQFVARAITPPRYPRRYDARFFCTFADSIAAGVAGAVHPDAEFTELCWLTFAEAYETDLPDITALVLREVEARLRRGFDPSLPVPFLGTDEGDVLRGYL